MRFTAKVILIGLLIYFVEPHVGWWWIAVASFLGGALIKTTGFQSFFAGIFGVGIIWLWMMLRIHIATESILTEKMADLLMLGHSGLLIGLTLFTGGLVGAVSCWTGHNFRKLIESRKRRGYYY